MKHGNNWRGGKIKTICNFCGKQFDVWIYQSKTDRKKYCSRSCLFLASRKNITIKCKQCEKDFNVNPCKKNRIFCSKSCSAQFQMKGKKGSNSHNWKGGRVTNRCGICDKEFQPHRGQIKRGFGKFCSHSCRAINGILKRRTFGTSIERIFEYELKKSGLKYYTQKPLPYFRTIPDFFIDPNICIYCDGDYWHNLPKQIKKDLTINDMLKNNGYKVYRFWEHEIKESVVKCVEKLMEDQ